MLYNEKLEKEKLDQELQLASKVHSNLLNQTLPLHQKMQFGILNIPARKLGGDFYDIIIFNQNKIAIIIADIVGKGISSCLYMAVLKSLVSRYVSNQSPKTILKKLSKVVYNDPVINSFIPMFLGVFDLKNNIFTYSNAGHEPAFIIRDKKFIKCTTTDLPIGSFKSQDFHQKEIKLQDDDLFFSFTDGMTELYDEKGDHLKVDGIKKLILNHIDFPPQTICNKLQTFIKSIAENIEKRDDITTIICKFLKYKQKLPFLLFSKEIVVSSDIKKIKFIRNIIKEMCTKAKFNQQTIFDIQLSVNVAQANIVEHSYLGEKDKNILFKFEVFKDRIIVTIKDFGIKYKKNTNQNFANSLDNLEGSGLGFFLIYSLMDEIKYEPTDMCNKLTLVKYDLK